MGNSSIEWTDCTWNPIRGCSMAKGSEAGGCLNCYAARMASRNLPEMRSPTTGEQFARILPSGPRWTGDVELIEKALTLPLKWRKPRKVFVNSMSDLFHESLTDEQIYRVFAVMALCPQHIFQVLTKRPERMKAWSGRFEGVMAAMRQMGVDVAAIRWPLPNVWLGVSCEDQATADARIPLLLQTPAAVRFVSYEPALGPVDFRQWLQRGELAEEAEGRLFPQTVVRRAFHWLIVGGESGPGARPFDVTWARNTVEQCKLAGVACFVKQFGARPMSSTHADWIGSHGAIEFTGNGLEERWFLRLKDRKGGDMDEWPEDLRVRQFPGALEAQCQK